MFKRAVDIFLSVLGILVLLPIFPIVALIIKLDSKGPIFYLCDRIGEGEELFRMFKFRTMYTTPTNVGPNVCPEGDPRVTSVGRILRRTKINEFPQLINILKGEMSFVGPRPEAPDLAALYPPSARAIFNVKPGLVGPNQIIGRNEEEWYPAGVDPQQYYIEEILPKKLPIDLDYIKNPSALIDFKYILLGIKETMFKLISWNIILRNKSQVYLLSVDIFLISLSAVISYYTFIHSRISDSIDAAMLLVLVIAIKLICFLNYGLYSSLIRHLSLHDIRLSLKSNTVGSFAIAIFIYIFFPSIVSPVAFLVDWLCLFLLMSLIRTGLRLYWDWGQRSRNEKSRRVLIYGAGDAGVLAHRSLATEKMAPFEVIGFLDDDPQKLNKSLYGLKVLGSRHNIETVVKIYQIDMIFLAMPSAPFSEIVKIANLCKISEIPYAIFPTLQLSHTNLQSYIRSKHNYNEFNCKHISIDEIELESIIKNSTILITGGCNELIIELCQQALKFLPKRIIIIDRYESQLNELLSRLSNINKKSIIHPVICNIRNNNSLSSSRFGYKCLN